MKILRVPNLNTVARIYHDRREIHVNGDIWDTLPAHEQKQIILHELGHNKLRTHNEFEADNYAFSQFVGTEPQSLKKSIQVLKNNLDDNIINRIRIREAEKRAARHDYYVNGNQKFKDMFNKHIDRKNIELVSNPISVVKQRYGRIGQTREEYEKRTQIPEYQQSQQPETKYCKTDKLPTYDNTSNRERYRKESEQKENTETAENNTNTNETVDVEVVENKPKLKFESEWVVWVVLFLLAVGLGTAFFKFRD